MSSQNNLSPDHHILEAARRLLQTHPDGDFTMDELAETAGLSRATLYRRSGGRQQVLRSLALSDGLDIGNIDQPDVRQRILEAARRVLPRTGLLGLTIEAVASEAGVGAATIYRHFGDRESLLQSLASSLGPRLASRQLAFSSSGDLQADLTHFVASTLQFLRENRQLVRLLVLGDAETLRLFGKLRLDTERTWDHLVNFFEGQIAAGSIHCADPRRLALALLGMMMAFGGLAPEALETNLPDLSQFTQPSGPEEEAAFIVRLFLSGITSLDGASI